MYMNIKNLHNGYSTGMCSAAAAYAAVYYYMESTIITNAPIVYAEHYHTVPVFRAGTAQSGTFGEVYKNDNDDFDVTIGVCIRVDLIPSSLNEHTFYAGEGVGRFTKPGFYYPVGEPAINKVPRQMICNAIKSVCTESFSITVSIPDGDIIAQKTMNPRLGIHGGLSILGTTGTVRPFSKDAIISTIQCACRVVAAQTKKHIIVVPGNIGYRAACTYFPEETNSIVEASNYWNSAFSEISSLHFKSCTLVGHPGKLLKLMCGFFNTHSNESISAKDVLLLILKKLSIPLPTILPSTTEGIFAMLSYADCMSVIKYIKHALLETIYKHYPHIFIKDIILIDMQGKCLGKE